MSRVSDIYRGLPRAGRWGVWAGAGLLGYFAVVEPIMDKTNALNSRADARAQAIAEVRSGGGAGAADLGLRRFGHVEPPGDPRERNVAFNRRVLEILETHALKDHASTTRNAPLNAGPLLTALAPSHQKVERHIREVQFEATPETLAAVIADLERTPEVAAVSRVQIRKPEGGGRIVRATIAAEAWSVQKKGNGR